MSIVRENLMTEKNYSPYCGSNTCKSMPRAKFNGEQFVCPSCGWISEFPIEFIAEYKNKWEPIIIDSGHGDINLREGLHSTDISIHRSLKLSLEDIKTRTISLTCPPNDVFEDLPKPYKNGSKYMRSKK